MIRFDAKLAVLLALLVALVLAACSADDGIIPPCTPVEGSDVDPCALTNSYGVQPPGTASGRSPDIDTTVPYTVRRFLGESITAAHLVVRGTYLPGTVRCAVHQGIRGAEWVFGEGGLNIDWPVTNCYADMRVNEYYLGSGPPMLTVLLQSSNLTTNRVGGERKYSDVVGREEIVFLGPSFDYSVEALQVYERWDVQRDDDSVIAVHPDRNYWLRVGGETHRAAVEMSLSDFAAAVTAAQTARMDEFSGKVSADTDAPAVQTDANKLHDFYVDAGAIENMDDTLILPPPPCGKAVPDQANNPGLMLDCFALLEAKDDLRGTAALNWDVTRAIGEWEGITVTGTPQRVTKLELANRSLTGSIPASLGKLDLTTLKLSGNSLTGCIPLALRSIATNDLDALGLPDCS